MQAQCNCSICPSWDNTWRPVTQGPKEMAPGRCDSNFKGRNFKLIIQNSILGTHCEIALRWIAKETTLAPCEASPGTTVGTPYNMAPYITGSTIARLGHGSQNSWSKLWIPVVESAPVRVIFAWKSVPKKRIHGSSDIYLGKQWKQRHDSPWSYRLDVTVTFLWYDTISTIGQRDHQSTAKKV